MKIATGKLYQRSRNVTSVFKSLLLVLLIFKYTNNSTIIQIIIFYMSYVIFKLAFYIIYKVHKLRVYTRICVRI